MILGMTTYTFIHVLLSLVGIASGFIVLGGLLQSKPLNGWTAVFLLTTIATSVTGFGFPFTQLLPSHIVGLISLVILAIACIARYPLHLAGAWRWIYVVAAAIALYFNVFVGVVQAFQKIPALRALAPTQSEPPFAIAQGAVLLMFVVLGFLATRKFHPAV